MLLGALLLWHLAYIASGLIELSQDEALYWLQSKHLALSYYSKPPLTAYTQFIGVTQHNLYHAGQIALLKKALGSDDSSATRPN